MPGKREAEEAGAQIDKFKEAARELGCDEDEAAFDAALKRVGGAKHPKPEHNPGRRKG